VDPEMMIDLDAIIHDAEITFGEDVDWGWWAGGSVAVVETRGRIEDWKVVASVIL
jgi:hypothetical protein